MHRILIVGQSGQLAQALSTANLAPGFHCFTLGRPALDLSAPETVEAAVRASAPTIVINAAAYTLVDKAEDEEEIATRVNGEGPAALASACHALNIPMVHVSSDYVFDGKKPAPYIETDRIAPISAYGRSKARGEAGVLASGARVAILRTSWVYSAHGVNFLKTILRVGASNAQVRVVGDQVGRPTSAQQLAEACLQLAYRLIDQDAAAEGVFHVSGAGPATSWAGFAEVIFQTAQRLGVPPVKVSRITTEEHPARARRPANSMLAMDKLEALIGPIGDWRDSVARCCAEVLERSGSGPER